MKSSDIVTYPTFVGVGAGKTGTSWLHLCLKEHPDVFMPGMELDFFSTHFNKGSAWYATFYAKAQLQVSGDISPSYMVDPASLQRLYDWNPDLKLIFSFRNPIERAYSHYCMLLRGGVVTENVDLEIDPQTRLVYEGLSYQHLMRFMTLFPRENILVLLYDDLKLAPRLYLQRVYEFLEIDNSFEPSILQKRYHVRKTRPRNQGFYNALVRSAGYIYRSSAVGAALVNELRKRDYVNIIHKLNEGPEFPQMSLQKKQTLVNYYRSDVEALSEFLQRDLTHWLR